jgi:hypothetical protein
MNKNGLLKVRNSKNKLRLRVDADAANCQIGGNGGDGQLMLSDAAGVNPEYHQPDTAQKANILLRASDAAMRAGGNGKDGDLILSPAAAKNPDSANESVIHLSARDGLVRVGGNGKHGEIALYDVETKGLENVSLSKSIIYIRAADGSIRVGGNGIHGDVHVFNSTFKKVIHLNGETGDILLSNADCAEDFDVDDSTIEPGSVLVLGDEAGRLRLSDAPYDTRVAGVLSGAGDYRPAIVLDRQPEREGRLPVALVGKVWCKVEARSAPIGVGSLLTTSSLPGHAMAATDRERAFGAVLGKALAPLTDGVGVVPVLVTLQ